MKPLVASFLLGVAVLAAWMVGAAPQRAAAAPLEAQPTLSVRLAPSSVKPGGTTLAIAKGTVPLTSAHLQWYLGERQVAEGVGLVRVRLKAPATYGQAEVRVVATLPSGEQAEGHATLSVASLVVIAEGGGYTFPTYAGRARVVPQSGVHLHAIALVQEGGDFVPADELVFSWEVRRASFPPQIGRGLDSIRIPPSPFAAPFEVVVTARAPNGTTARERVRITFDRPRILFYEEHPLLGPRYDRYLNPVRAGRAVATVVAEPMYFASPTRTASLRYFWRYNGAPIPDATGPRVTVSAPEDGSRARARLALTITHTRLIRQEAAGQVVVEVEGR